MPQIILATREKRCYDQHRVQAESLLSRLAVIKEDCFLPSYFHLVSPFWPMIATQCSYIVVLFINNHNVTYRLCTQISA